MNFYWLTNQIGIVIEVIGAGVIVVSAFITRYKIRDIPDSYDAALAEILRDVISKQAFTELFGFGLLTAGLVMQFIGGFG